MSTDDNHTPAHLSAARLAEIRAVATAAPADLYAEPDPGATCDECGEHCGERGVILRTPGGGGALLVLSDDNDAATVAFHRDARAMVLVLLAHLDALTPRDREQGGQLVRKVWIAWAKEQPAPKASWLVEWEGLSEPDREVDRRIFETCFAAGRAILAPRSAFHAVESCTCGAAATYCTIDGLDSKPVCAEYPRCKRSIAEQRPPCPGEGWEWDAFALQWHQPGAKGPAIGRAF